MTLLFRPSKDERIHLYLFHFAEVLGTGSSSWQSEDGGPNSRRGGETPSSCATPTSVSFPSEPEADADVGANADGSNVNSPYPCQFCDRTFPRLSYLKKHEQVIIIFFSIQLFDLKTNFFEIARGRTRGRFEFLFSPFCMAVALEASALPRASRRYSRVIVGSKSVPWIHNRLYRSGCSSRWLLTNFDKSRFHIRELNRRAFSLPGFRINKDNLLLSEDYQIKRTRNNNPLFYYFSKEKQKYQKM